MILALETGVSLFQCVRQIDQIVLCEDIRVRAGLDRPGPHPNNHSIDGHVYGLGLPNIVVETRSITVLKSLDTDSGDLGRRAAPMYLAERRAGLVDALPIPGVKAMRRFTAFRRRRGILPGPATKLIEELRGMEKAKSRISFATGGAASR